MKTTFWKPAALSILTALLLTSCASGSVMPDNSAGGNQFAGQTPVLSYDRLAEGESNPYLAVTYSVSSMAELRALKPESANATVTLRGYYEPGDGGGGTFWWDAAATAPENGGTIIQADGTETGRFIRLCESSYRNVKWFGAVGSGKKDDYRAIQNAIDSLPQSGGTVVFPGGTYAVSQTIRIGNGNGAQTFSTQNAVKLIGQGAGFAVTGDAIPTTIVAAKSMASLISVNGRISDVLI